jgi:DNA-binding transcriptional regulator LsrR (DeoR family)
VGDAAPSAYELLVKAARMYFLDGRSQEDIARVLGTGRSSVSRMLARARTLGIVEVRIQDGLGRDADLEQALSDRFGLTHVRVAEFRPHQDALVEAAELAAEWLDDTLQDGQVLAFSWGTTLKAVVAAVSAERARSVEVVPLVGGRSTGAPLEVGQELVRELADRLGGTYRYLHGPALLHSETAREALLAEPSIGRVVARARAADIALVGIGTVDIGSMVQIFEGMGLSEAQRAAFLAQKPAGDICCRFFDADGRPIKGVVHDRVLAVELEDLRHIPTVVGVAIGAEKTPGVLAALRGRILDGLITDACLAHSILTAGGPL